MRRIFIIILTFLFSTGLLLVTPRAEEGVLMNVYKKYWEAVSNFDLEQFKTFITLKKREEINATPAGKARLMLGAARVTHPKDIIFVREELNSSTGILVLSGTNVLSQKKNIGDVHFIKEDGQWKIKKESWHDQDNK